MPGFVFGALATVICRDCCLDVPTESETRMVKLKLPVAVGVPEMVPVADPRSRPVGRLPDASEKP